MWKDKALEKSRMSFDLPDFDYLKKLAEEDPEELDFLCHFYSRQIIDNAPANYQNRLNGLLFQIEVSRSQSSNSLHSCINLSKMMLDAFDHLSTVLNQIDDIENSSVKKNKALKNAKLLQFNRPEN